MTVASCDPFEAAKNVEGHYERQVFANLRNKNLVETKGVSGKEKDDIPQYASNKIRTAMYTRFNFFPKSFMLQFTKLANVYWGICVILQFYEPIRTASPILVLFFLLFVVNVGVFKEWWSDVKRQRADNLVNNKIY